MRQTRRANNYPARKTNKPSSKRLLNNNETVGLPPGLDLSGYFFAYVCRKRRLTLPLHAADRLEGGARLPHGWVKGSRALAAK